jgi:hypothetical protein
LRFLTSNKIKGIRWIALTLRLWQKGKFMEIKSKEIKIVPIESIIPNPKNPNKHDESQIDRLCKLFEFQGFRQPLIISNRTGFLVCGHGRLMAAQKLKVKELPVIFQDFLSEAQEYAFLVSDNEIARWSEFDKIKAYEDLKEIDLGDFELLGFEKNPYEIKELNSEEISDFKQEILVVITCVDENEQSSLFSEFQQRGLNCKII